MKKSIFIACLLMLAARLSYAVAVDTLAPNPAALINVSWIGYATDTSLTYRQIVTTCDSLFALAGYTLLSENRDTADGADSADKYDGSPFMNYNVWKNFWAFRCDATTGKLHSFATDALTMLADGLPPTDCAGTSPLQSSYTTVPTAPQGWQFVGPQTVSIVDEGEGNSLHQHLGQVNGIIVNPANVSEIYATDAWGGIWKTTNAGSAPNNTWVCLSDHMPWLAGIGITNLFVDFSTTPHHLLCVAGEPFAYALPNINNKNPHTVGIFYSLDDGATFNQMDISAIPNLATNPIMAMQYWPGNAGSATKYLFVATQLQVYRVNITNPAAPSWSAMLDLTSDIPSASHTLRFRGFSNIGFLPANSTIMYVTTNSNHGEEYPNSAALYRVSSCNTCTSCTYTNIPITQSDYLNGLGTFDSTGFPYGEWYSSGGWSHNSTSKNMFCTPADTAASVEADVDGSYLDGLTYTISFTLSLPAHSEVDVVLKDANDNNKDQADWGPLTTGPDTGTVPGSNYYVGPGAGGGAAGHYKNNSDTTLPITETNIAVSTTHFVDRLEFATYRLSGYTSGNVTLDNVKVVQPFENYLNNLATSSATPHDMYCYSNTGDAKTGYVDKIHDQGTSFPVDTFNTIVAFGQADIYFQPSTVDSNIVYEYANQTPYNPMNFKLNLSTNVTTNGVTTGSNPIHCDGRSMLLLPNATHTDDTIYMGEDGGIAVGKFNGTWTNLNGSGMKTSWAIDVGSNTHTGVIGIAATDNCVMTANPLDLSHWTLYWTGDGGQIKYGKRYATRDVQFEGGSSGGTAFVDLYTVYLGGLPVIGTLPSMESVNAQPLSKMVTTYNNEYFGTGGDDSIYDVVVSGAGTVASPYNLKFASLTEDISYNKREPVQAVAPDMYDANYLAAYVHTQTWDQGYFAVTKNATAAMPTWVVKDNHASFPGSTDWTALVDLVADPRSSESHKRLWAGAGNYYIADTDRVFQSVDGDTTWTDMSHGLPSGPVNALVYDDQSHYLFAGTDQGVYAFNVDSGANSASNPWKCFSLNLPNSFVTGLDINRCTGKLYVSLYGRGVYEAELPPDLNATGNSTADGALGSSDICDIDRISATTTWTQDRDETRSVYIPSGVTLTIQSCTINMGKDKYIVVSPGGKLIVNHATITNGCGYMWGGIEAIGNNSEPQYAFNQGWVLIEDSSVIEYARAGVANWNIADSDATTAGGIIDAGNSSFINNHAAVSFNAYHNYHGSTLQSNLSSFTNCIFLTDNDYKGDSLTYPFGADAWLMGVEGISFKGDSFLNRNTISTDRGTGIYSYNSGFSVEPYCSGVHYINTCPSSTPSQFTGFLNGIYASGDVSLNPTISIDQTGFDSSSIGIYESNISSLSATRNQFTIGDAPTLNDVEYGTCSENIGIYSQNCPQFRIEQNSFDGNDAATSFGAVVLNSGPNDKVVYRNSFSQLTYACFAQGVNSNAAPPGGDFPPLPTGLTFQCNNYSLNTDDIVVGTDNNLYHGIKEYQGSGTSAGNVFNDDGIVINNGAYFVYNYKESDEEPTLSGSSTTTFASLAYYDNSCTATFSSTPTLSPATLGNATIGTYKINLNGGKVIYNDSLHVYNNLIDDGKTSDYINGIQSEKDSASQIALLNNTSPFVSYQALLALKAKPQVSRSRYISILTDNPEVLRDSVSLYNLVATDDNLFKTPATCAEINTLKCASHKSTRNSSLSASIRDAHEQMAKYTGLLLMAMKINNDSDYSVADSSGDNICTDTTSVYYGLDSNSCFNNLDSVVTCLQNTGELWAQYDIAGYYNFTGQLRLMGDLMAAIPGSFSLDTAQTSEYNDYDTIVNILTTLSDSGKTINQLNLSQIASLTNISAPVSANEATVIGGTILNIHNAHIYPFLPCTLVAIGGRAANNSSNQHGNDNQQDFSTISPVNNLRLNDQLSAYPNPARDKVIFKYSVPDALGDIILSITNELGERMASFTITNNAGTISWDSRNMASGVYIYQMSDDNGLIATGRIVIER